MIVFKKIRYQNLLATGNYFNEVDFLASRSTLIVGSNGQGKSSIQEALTFALYGRAFRKVNLGQLVNSITGKGLLVELEFSIGSKEYKIRRGLKPNVFEIFVDGSIMKAKGVKEDQKYLEENILKMSFKTYSQIVVLSATNYVPFMNLSAGDRRIVVENLLDIQVFTTMNSLLKSYVDENSDLMMDIDRKSDVIEGKIEVEQKNLDERLQDNDKLVAEKTKKIDEHKDRIATCSEGINSLMSLVDSLLESITDKDKVSAKRSKLLQYEVVLEDKIRAAKNEIKFFEDHTDCPTCRQDIEEGFRTETIAARASKKAELEDAVKKLEDEVELVTKRIEEIGVVQAQINEHNRKISEYNQSIKFARSYIADLEEEIESIQNKVTSTGSSNLETLKRELVKLNKEKEELVKQKAMYVVAGKLLKDTGIKTKIINQYIPVMNSLINKYLAKMELFAEFHLDENFNETIKSRHRDSFTFDSFSEGEKVRITLAILFTWRAIAKMRNSVSTNLLIMDEVFDGSADLDGIDSMVDIIHDVFKDENIFVISHSDKMVDKMDSCIRVEKVGNFSKLTRIE